MAARARKPGEFCWFDVMTRDLDKTKALFTKLFGWSYREDSFPGGKLTLARSGDALLGALHDLDADPRGKGVPPHWGAHVMIKDADATAKLITDNGGKMRAPVMDIGENGRMCVFEDPTGGNLCAWQAKKEPGMNCDPMAHGSPSWIELMTMDVDRAGAFYAKVFGWTPATDKGGYTLFKLNGDPVAGMHPITKEMGPMPAHWGCYMTVKDCDQTAKECTAAGGSVVMPPRTIEGTGRFAVLKTAEGIHFSVIAWT